MLLFIIMWLYLSGGIALYALSSDLGEPRDKWLTIGCIVWPVTVTLCIASGLLDSIVTGFRGVIGK